MTSFEHEKLEVYQLELAFISWLSNLFEEFKDTRAARVAEVCDHLDRASLACLLNTATGNGVREREGRAKRFAAARVAAIECATCLDTMVAKYVCRADRLDEGKEKLARIVAMLTQLAGLPPTPGPLSSAFPARVPPSGGSGE